MSSRWLLLLLVAACGRIGFEPPPDPIAAALGFDVVAHWPFDERPGATTFEDLSSLRNDGSCVECPTAGVDGVKGRAIEFAAADAGILIDASDELRALDGPLTLAGWARISNYQGYGVILSNDRDCCGGPHNGFSLWASHYSEGPAMLTWSGTSNLTRGPRAPLDTWFHVVGTYDGTNQRLYVDGVEVFSNDTAALSSPFDYETWIGAEGYQAPQYHLVDAALDEVVVIRGALTPEQVVELYSFY